MRFDPVESGSVDLVVERVERRVIGSRLDQGVDLFDPGEQAVDLTLRKIEDEVESLLSEEIIAERLKKGDIPVLRLFNHKLKLTT